MSNLSIPPKTMELRNKTLNSLNKLTELLNDSNKISDFAIKLKVKECIDILSAYYDELNDQPKPQKPTITRLAEASNNKADLENRSTKNDKLTGSSTIKDRIKLLTNFSTAQKEMSSPTSPAPESPKITSNFKFWRQLSREGSIDSGESNPTKQSIKSPAIINDDAKAKMKVTAVPKIPDPPNPEPGLEEENAELATSTIFSKTGEIQVNGQLQILTQIPQRFRTLTEIKIKNWEVEPQILLNSFRQSAVTIKSIQLLNLVLVGIFTETLSLPNLKDYKINFCFKEYLPITQDILKSLLFWDTKSPSDSKIEFDYLTNLGVSIDIMIRKRIVLRLNRESNEFIKNYAMVDENEEEGDDIIYPPKELDAAQAMSQLKSLALRNCIIADPVHTIPTNLTHLNLYKTEIIQGDLDSVFHDMKHLKDLRVTPFIDRLSINMDSLGASSALAHLSVYNVELKHSNKSTAPVFQNLQTLCLDFCCLNEGIVNNFSDLFPNLIRICLFDPTNNNSNYLLLLEILQMRSVEWLWFDKFKDQSFQQEDFLKSIGKILKRSGCGSELASEEIVQDCQHWIYFNLEKGKGGGVSDWKVSKESGPAKIRFEMFGMHKFWKSYEAFQKETVRVMGTIHCCEGTLTC